MKLRRALALGMSMALSAASAQAAARAGQTSQPDAQTSRPSARTTPPAGQTSRPDGDSGEPPPPAGSGRVLFSRGAGDSPPIPAPVALPVLGEDDPLRVTDAERSALRFTAYDLDLHLQPAGSAIAVRAGMSLRNDSSSPLTRIVLQISSTLRWEGVSLGGRALAVASRLVNTDADHTGAMTEAVVTLPEALAPGAVLNLSALYAGPIPVSAERLARTGAPEAEARATDWDEISAPGTFLRGFGHVLWYPVCAPAVFFREGDRLFDSVGEVRLRDASTTVRLRLSVEYQGEPPDAVFLGGRRETVKAISDNPAAPAADAPGIATAAFGAEPLGFRTLDLFITAAPPVQAGTASDPGLISAVTTQESGLNAYTTAATELEPLLAAWFGAHAQSPLYLVDHPGQPYEDDTLLVRPLKPGDADALSVALAHSLTHAWIHSAQPWIDEGLAEFVRLLWLERTGGRDAALAALQDGSRSLASAESATGPADEGQPMNFSSSGAASGLSSGAGQPLIAARSELFYRTKAAAVWWMLRGIAGDPALRQALQAYRADAHADRDPQGFERALEKASHKDLRWFFDDWVYRDRGLPRLSIASVAPSELKGRTGIPDGWMIAVEVRNDGDAVADVPVTVRSAGSAQTERLRIPGRSNASTRIVFAGTPDEVVVNDGSVPESGPSPHSRRLSLGTR